MTFNLGTPLFLLGFFVFCSFLISCTRQFRAREERQSTAQKNNLDGPSAHTLNAVQRRECEKSALKKKTG